MSQRKTKTIAWIVVLAASHLAAFLAARQQPQPDAPGTGAVAGGDFARDTKSRERDPGASRYGQLWQKLLETPMSRADFERARDNLLRDWMKRDLGAVLDLVYGPEASGGFGRLRRMEDLDAEIAKNPQQVMDWIRSGRFGSCRQEVFQQWFSALQRDGQVEVILAALPEGTKYEQSWSLASLAGNGKEEALAGVRKALETWYREGTARKSVMDSYARRKAQLAAGDTAALFAQETDPEIRQSLGDGWVDARIGYPPAASRMGELRELPEDARARAVAGIMTTFDDDGIKGVAPALAEMNRLAMWNELASEGTRQAVLVSAERGGDQRAVLESVMAIADAGTRAKLLESVGQGMPRGGDGEAAFGTVFELLPEGADRDACLAGIVTALRPNHPDQAKRGLQHIAGQAVRARLLEQMPDLTK